MIKYFAFALDDGRTGEGRLEEIQQRLEAWSLPGGTPILDDSHNQIPTKVGETRIFFSPADGNGSRKRAGVIILATLIPERFYKFAINPHETAEPVFTGEGSADQVERAIAAHELTAGFHFNLPNGSPSRRLEPLKLGETAGIVVGSGTSPADYKEKPIGTVTFAEER